MGSAVQALERLAHAHTLRFLDEAGMDEAGHLKVTDFGIAKPQRPSSNGRYETTPASGGKAPTSFARR